MRISSSVVRACTYISFLRTIDLIFAGWCIDSKENNAVNIACRNGRIKVLRWLAARGLPNSAYSKTSTSNLIRCVLGSMKLSSIRLVHFMV